MGHPMGHPINIVIKILYYVWTFWWRYLLINLFRTTERSNACKTASKSFFYRWQVGNTWLLCQETKRARPWIILLCTRHTYMYDGPSSQNKWLAQPLFSHHQPMVDMQPHRALAKVGNAGNFSTTSPSWWEVELQEHYKGSTWMLILLQLADINIVVYASLVRHY